MLRSAAKIDVLNIAYKGAGAALNDIIAGHVQFQVNTTLATLPFIQTGKLRALATCGAKRTSTLPQVPTVAETIPGFESSGWYALLGPAGMPRDVVMKLYGAFSKAIQSPDLIKRLTEQGVDVLAGNARRADPADAAGSDQMGGRCKSIGREVETKTRGTSPSPAAAASRRRAPPRRPRSKAAAAAAP